VTAVQYMGPTVSPVSNSVTVLSQLSSPAVEIFGGEGFFNAEQGEQQIDGPVFPRGKGKGPLIKLQTCCQSEVKAQILGPNNAVLADLILNEEFPGYYSAQWNWKFNGNTPVATKIPVGAYTVVASSKCTRETARKRFYVIFDPAEVNGPDRFSFNETGIWFGTSSNASKALVYHLHPDDARVFMKALNAANGQTESLTAARKVATVEENLFSYSLSYHTNDVLTMLANFTEAQCADDANVLTAMLRAIGIPAHPATADAALETGAANWTFDTWTEFLAPNPSTPEWLILHPHEYPGDLPMSRGAFGANKGVATKQFNDLVIMAGENWDVNQVADNTSDVTYARLDCGEPRQAHLSVANWLLDLCENGYWTPNHWDCAGIRTLSLRIPSSRFSNTINPGGSYEGRFVVTNTTKEAIKDELLIELLSDDPSGKAFPDAVLVTERQRLEIHAGERAEFSFKLPVPRQMQPGHQILLRIRTAKEMLFLNALKLQGIDVTVKTSERKRVGDDLTIVATIVNRSDRVLEGGRVALFVPPGVAVASPLAEVRALKPGEQQEITWKAKLTAPLEVGSIRVVVTTLAQGWAEAIEPLSISNPSANAPSGVIR
ncbi:MAG TPA: transglutaminase domain-containing protein, partial [Blastocatellia bacterium]|nr:transglutaminase domain-containing protein [Blastocatellia bacterium]